ncbi:hypothetical protein AMS68_003367 [Peltaster fructicola]|uniref:NADH-cytochrome b5 reductase 2 n=1 Tax=Peltaster fructicola TaxID=286661 RepID=A0A6H0XTR7_9PEZI|nr:hypothetical protein AMS68_003367 [Peltaster fructicola]
MASMLPMIRARPLLITAAIATATGTAYYATQRPLYLDAAGSKPSTKTFSFPSSMLFARQLTVTNVEQINHDTKRITFSLPGGQNEITGVPAGAAILTQHTPAGRWFPVLRPYTPVQDPASKGVLELVVKQYPNGAASTHMHSLEPGNTLTVRGPIPGYSWKASTEPRDVLFVAGGAGITPLYSLAHAIVTDETDRTRVNLLWGVNGTRDIILKQELEALEKRYPDRLKVTYLVSGPEGKADAPSLGAADKFKKGYIDQTVLAESIQRFSSFGDEKGTQVFFCGPPTMQSSITGKDGVLAKLGIDKKKTHIF